MAPMYVLMHSTTVKQKNIRRYQDDTKESWEITPKSHPIYLGTDGFVGVKDCQITNQVLSTLPNIVSINREANPGLCRKSAISGFHKTVTAPGKKQQKSIPLVWNTPKASPKLSFAMLQIPANLRGHGCLIPSCHFERLGLNLDALQTSRTKNCKTTLAANNLTSMSGYAAETVVRVQKRRAELPLLHHRYHRPPRGHKASPGKGQDSCPSGTQQPSLQYGQRKEVLMENMEARLHTSVAVGLSHRAESRFCPALAFGTNHWNSSCLDLPVVSVTHQHRSRDGHSLQLSYSQVHSHHKALQITIHMGSCLLAFLETKQGKHSQ